MITNKLGKIQKLVLLTIGSSTKEKQYMKRGHVTKRISKALDKDTNNLTVSISKAVATLTSKGYIIKKKSLILLTVSGREAARTIMDDIKLNNDGKIDWTIIVKEYHKGLKITKKTDTPKVTKIKTPKPTIPATSKTTKKEMNRKYKLFCKDVPDQNLATKDNFNDYELLMKEFYIIESDIKTKLEVANDNYTKRREILNDENYPPAQKDAKGWVGIPIEWKEEDAWSDKMKPIIKNDKKFSKYLLECTKKEHPTILDEIIKLAIDKTIQKRKKLTYTNIFT